jgi:hypothetical protein
MPLRGACCVPVASNVRLQMLLHGDHYVSRTAQRLLAGRDLQQLSPDEFHELLLSYNHVGAGQASLLASRIAISLYPSDLRLCQWHAPICFAQLSTLDIEIEFEALSSANSINANYWRIALADNLMCCAWGSDEEFLGAYPENWELLDRAADILSDRVLITYFDNHLRQRGVFGAARKEFSFIEWFDGIFRFAKYPHPENSA